MAEEAPWDDADDDEMRDAPSEGTEALSAEAEAALLQAKAEGLTLLKAGPLYRGVTFHTPYAGRSRPWRASARRIGGRKHLGYFATAEEAALAYARTHAGKKAAAAAEAGKKAAAAAAAAAPLDAEEALQQAEAEELVLPSSTNPTGYRGVSLVKDRIGKKPYHAEIRRAGKLEHVGYFATVEQAALASARARARAAAATSAAEPPPAPAPAQAAAAPKKAHSKLRARLRERLGREPTPADIFAFKEAKRARRFERMAVDQCAAPAQAAAAPKKAHSKLRARLRERLGREPTPADIIAFKEAKRAQRFERMAEEQAALNDEAQQRAAVLNEEARQTHKRKAEVLATGLQREPMPADVARKERRAAERAERQKAEDRSAAAPAPTLTLKKELDELLTKLRDFDDKLITTPEVRKAHKEVEVLMVAASASMARLAKELGHS